MSEMTNIDFLGKLEKILSLDEIRDRIEFDFPKALKKKSGNEFMRLYTLRLKAWNLLRKKYVYFHSILVDDSHSMISVEDHKAVCSSILVSLEHCVKDGLRLYGSLKQMGRKCAKDIERFLGDPSLSFESNDCELAGICICDMAHEEPYTFSCLSGDLTSPPRLIKDGEQKRLASSGSLKALKIVSGEELKAWKKKKNK